MSVFSSLCPLSFWLKFSTFSFVSLIFFALSPAVLMSSLKFFCAGETEEEGRLYPTQLAVTDTLGRWRVDGLATPPISPLMSYICYTNIVDNWQVSHYPLQLGIYARRKPFGSYDAERVIPNVTDENHRAVEKTIAATERKSGKKMKRLNPMTNFPVSTNNVIHAPDLILP